MSYSTLLSNEGINSQFLAIIKPKRQVSSWTLISGTKYYNIFNFGQIINLTSNGIVKTQATSSSLSDGQWFFDETISKLYIDIGVNPNTKIIIVTYEFYISTFDAHFYRIPNSNASRVVYYEPLIVKSPSIIQSSSDILFGFLPSQSSTIIISNVTTIFQSHLYDSSFNNCDIDIWHYLDELTVDNVNLIFKGLCGNIDINDDEISLSIFDRNFIFENEYRNTIDNNFYDYSLFPNLDSNFNNRPIRNVFGKVDAFIPVNIDYVYDNPTTSDNRIFICISEDSNIGSVNSVVPISPSSTTTRTYLTSSSGFNIGDSVWIDSASGSGFDEFKIITNVGINYVEHSTVTNIASSSSVVKRSFVGNIKIYKSNIEYSPLFGRDYIEYIDSTNHVIGFEFNTTLEANLSFPNNLTPSDLIYARIYGHKNVNTLGGNPFGSNSLIYGNLTQGIVILYSILKNNLGLSEADLDLTVFQDLQLTLIDEIGFAIPEDGSSNFPTYKDLSTKIINSLLLRMFLNNSNKWSFSILEPFINYINFPKEVEDDEIIQHSINYNIDYSDIYSKIIVLYSKREVSTKNQISDQSYSSVTSYNYLAQYLHNIKKQKTFYSLHINLSEAEILANRIAFYFGDRKGLMKISVKNRFFDTLLGDKINISRTRMIGFDFNENINRQRSFSISNTEKSLNNVNIELDDQKGVEDNYLNW